MNTTINLNKNRSFRNLEIKQVLVNAPLRNHFNTMTFHKLDELIFGVRLATRYRHELPTLCENPL